MGFKDYTIEECCEILNNLRFPLNSEQRFEMKGEYPYYGANGVQGYINKWRFDDDLILIAEDGGNFEQYATRPIAYRVNGKCWVNNHAHVIKAKNEFSQSFIFYSLEHKNILFFIAGGTRSKLTQSELKRIILKHPRKEEADKIGNIIQITDEAIAHTEALIAKYQRIKTGLMQDLLTKGIDENGNIRSRATHKFVVKNGIEVPEEWEVDTLGTLIKAIDAHPSHRTPTSIENGAPYLGISDIDDEGNIDLKKCRKVSYSVLAEHNNRYQLRDGDIIFGKIGTIGEPKRLKAWNNVTISANVILIQPHNTSDFIFWVLNSEYINNQVKNTIHSTSQPAFGMEKVRALTILIPPKNERETIQNILNQNESNILSTKRHLSKLQSLKTGLMQDLLSGKVRVNMDNKN